MVYKIQAKLVHRGAFSMAAKYCFGSFFINCGREQAH